MGKKKLVLGTRSSKLAMWQAEHIAHQLELNGFETTFKTYETIGDKILNVSLQKVGSKGLFTEELEKDLIDGSIDLAIHSAKDLQATMPEGLDILAYDRREDVGDVVLSLNKGFMLGNGHNQKVGTSAVRRVAMLNHYFPKVQTVPVRGNLQTRFKKLEQGEVDALILAGAGVSRMRMDEHIVQRLNIQQFVPPTGQGSIAIQARSAISQELKEQIRETINHSNTEHCVQLERTFLSVLDGGCSIPSFAHAYFLDDFTISMTAGLAHKDKIIRIDRSFLRSEGFEPAGKMGEEVLADGGKELLETLR